MLDLRVAEGYQLDSQFFLRKANKEYLESLGIFNTEKVPKNIHEHEMLKFLSLSGVTSVLHDEAAKNYLEEARGISKPLWHEKQEDSELLNTLKTRFMDNHEASGMTVKAFHDSMVEDKRSR